MLFPTNQAGPRRFRWRADAPAPTQPAKLRPAKPSSIVVQVAGSGTAAVGMLAAVRKFASIGALVGTRGGSRRRWRRSPFVRRGPAGRRCPVHRSQCSADDVEQGFVICVRKHGPVRERPACGREVAGECDNLAQGRGARTKSANLRRPETGKFLGVAIR